MRLEQSCSVARLVVVCSFLFNHANDVRAQCHRALIYERDTGTFGGSLAIDGKYLIFGGSGFHADNRSGSGVATVFAHIDRTWFEHARLTSDDPSSLKFFGADTDISGDYFVAGAWGDHGGCPPENPRC